MNQGGGVSNGGAVPTGCYKCGRPGHWSRDCPSETNTSSATNNINKNNGSQDFRPDSGLDPSARSRPPLPGQKPKQEQPKRTRPKLTPDLLLSDAGVGHILKYFPRALKCRGRGHEADDLQHLLSLYSDWHSRFMPYYNFEQFIDKVERVGSARHVKVCLRELREKVSNGVDPTKLQEPQVQQDSIDEQDAPPSGLDMPSTVQEDNMQTEDNHFQEEMPQSIWEEATQEPSQPVQVEVVANDTSRAEEVPGKRLETNPDSSTKNLLTEEQRARMEANKLRALERAAARSRSSQSQAK